MLASCGDVRLDPPPAPTPTLVAAPLATTIPEITSRELMEHKRFREDFGLRSDDAWIQEVARDPASDRRAYGVPLTSAELSALQDRMVNIDAMRVAIGDYGAAHANDFAGAFIDQGRGGILVVQFAGSFETHRAAILRLVRPDASIEVRPVRWSLEELEAYSAQLRGEDAWFRSIPAYLKGYGVRISANRVIIDVSTLATDLAEVIERHFRWPEGVALVESDGTGALLLPMGALRIEAIDPQGKPVHGLACVAVPDIDGAYESRPMPMPTTDSRGICVLRLPATGYRIQLERGAGPPTVVAIGRAVVGAARTTEVTIRTP